MIVLTHGSSRRAFLGVSDGGQGLETAQAGEGHTGDERHEAPQPEVEG